MENLHGEYSAVASWLGAWLIIGWGHAALLQVVVGAEDQELAS